MGGQATCASVGACTSAPASLLPRACMRSHERRTGGRWRVRRPGGWGPLQAAKQARPVAAHYDATEAVQAVPLPARRR
jgi:hypothetical protein